MRRCTHNFEVLPDTLFGSFRQDISAQVRSRGQPDFERYFHVHCGSSLQKTHVRNNSCWRVFFSSMCPGCNKCIICNIMSRLQPCLLLSLLSVFVYGCGRCKFYLVGKGYQPGTPELRQTLSQLHRPAICCSEETWPLLQSCLCEYGHGIHCKPFVSLPCCEPLL